MEDTPKKFKVYIVNWNIAALKTCYNKKIVTVQVIA